MPCQKNKWTERYVSKKSKKWGKQKNTSSATKTGVFVALEVFFTEIYTFSNSAKCLRNRPPNSPVKYKDVFDVFWHFKVLHINLPKYSYGTDLVKYKDLFDVFWCVSCRFLMFLNRLEFDIKFPFFSLGFLSVLLPIFDSTRPNKTTCGVFFKSRK